MGSILERRTISRRRFLTGALIVAGGGAAFLAGCGGKEENPNVLGKPPAQNTEPNFGIPTGQDARVSTPPTSQEQLNPPPPTKENSDIPIQQKLEESNYTLYDVNRQQVDLKEIFGEKPEKPRVIAFVAPGHISSEHNTQALDLMSRLQLQFDGQAEFLVIAYVSSDSEIRFTQDQAGLKPSITFYMQPEREWGNGQGISLEFGIGDVPAYAIIDKEGRISGRIVGWDQDPQVTVAVQEVISH